MLCHQPILVVHFQTDRSRCMDHILTNGSYCPRPTASIERSRVGVELSRRNSTTDIRNTSVFGVCYCHMFSVYNWIPSTTENECSVHQPRFSSSSDIRSRAIRSTIKDTRTTTTMATKTPEETLSYLFPPLPVHGGGTGLSVSQFPGTNLEAQKALVKLLKENHEKYHIFFNDRGFHKYVTEMLSRPLLSLTSVKPCYTPSVCYLRSRCHGRCFRGSVKDARRLPTECVRLSKRSYREQLERVPR